MAPSTTRVPVPKNRANGRLTYNSVSRVGRNGLGGPAALSNGGTAGTLPVSCGTLSGLIST